MLTTGQVMLTMGQVMLTMGQVMLTMGQVMLTMGQVMLTMGQVMLTTGQVMSRNRSCHCVCNYANQHIRVHSEQTIPGSHLPTVVEAIFKLPALGGGGEVATPVGGSLLTISAQVPSPCCIGCSAKLKYTSHAPSKH